MRMIAGSVSLLSLVLAAAPATAQINSTHGHSIEDTRAAATAQLPTCPRPLGTMALSEPETRWWGDLGLGSPEALIRVYVQQSHCFRLVNRSARGMAAMQQERALSAGGETQRGGTFGKGQMVEADFTVIPDIVTGNRNRSGTNVGGMLGGLMGGTLGGIVGGINVRKQSANVILNVVNNKSSEEFVAEGQAKKTSLGFGAGAGIFGGGVLAAGGASGYDNTEIGQVVALAYLDAYTKLVQQIGGLQEAIGGQQAERAVTMARPGTMRSGPAVTAATIKPLAAGTMLYPTGQKQGLWWQVEDELGTKGWVSEASLSVAH